MSSSVQAGKFDGTGHDDERGAIGSDGTETNPFRRMLRRLTSDLTTDMEQLDADDLTSDAERSGAQPANECACGQEVTVLGRLRSVDFGSCEAAPCLQAEIFDGTEGIGLIWLGRRRIPGIEAGRTMRVRGRIALRDGRKVLYNPYYEICQAQQ